MLSCVNKAGLLETQTDEKGNATTYYTYDKAGRRIRLLSHTRDITADCRVPRTAPTSKTSFGLTSKLRSQNSLSNFIKDDKITSNAQRLYVSYTYDNMMREVSRTFGNGVSQYTEYDSIGRTSLITEKSFG